MKIIAITALVAVFVGFAAAQNDWTIIPGKRLGPIVATTSRADLERLFGKSNVEDKPVDTGEGPEPATVVFGRDPSAALALLWRDNLIDRVLVCYESQFGPCKWHTGSGISLGTTLARLEALNGHAFVAEPWGSDVGGNITSWEGGKLARELGDGGDFQLLLTLYYKASTSGPTSRQREALTEIDRQRRAFSSDPAMRTLSPLVNRMVVFFPGQRSN